MAAPALAPELASPAPREGASRATVSSSVAVWEFDEDEGIEGRAIGIWEGERDGLSTALNGRKGPEPSTPRRRNGRPHGRLPPPPVGPHAGLLAGRGRPGDGGLHPRRLDAL